jgi:ubiquinone/menaquinone biosynthesis C-methylase UbiE
MIWTGPDREEAPDEAPEGHEELFTSGAYIASFRPEASTNPFARAYAAKRDTVISLVPGQGLRVLDVGGAMGRMAIPLARHHQVTLCDLSLDMLRLAGRSSGGAMPARAVADAGRLPFRAASFDCVLCIDVLPHLPDPGPALAEARRVLRGGGRIIVDSTNSLPLWTLAYPRYLGRRPRRWVGIWRSGGVLPEWSHRVRHRRRGEFLQAVRAAGFQVRSVRGFGPPICPKWHLAVATAR